jgi:hypothetical protein
LDCSNLSISSQRSSRRPMECTSLRLSGDSYIPQWENDRSAQKKTSRRQERSSLPAKDARRGRAPVTRSVAREFAG